MIQPKRTAPIVGLIGRKRVGKDTFANVLCAEYEYHRIAFADPLREAALGLNPLVGSPALPGATHPGPEVRLRDVIEAIGWEKAKDYVPEVRGTLQRLGTDSIRALDPTFWVRAAMTRVDILEDTPIVMTDVRFPNEADAIRARDGLLLRIIRPDVRDEDPHPTERALDYYDVDQIIENVTTVEEFREIARYVGRSIH